eukprot:Tbor_TRINITY_DN4224_c0_g1::TRINITY_DN4224_c0_g1_i1::g.24048::m.24048
MPNNLDSSHKGTSHRSEAPDQNTKHADDTLIYPKSTKKALERSPPYSTFRIPSKYDTIGSPIGSSRVESSRVSPHSQKNLSNSHSAGLSSTARSHGSSQECSGTGSSRKVDGMSPYRREVIGVTHVGIGTVGMGSQWVKQDDRARRENYSRWLVKKALQQKQEAAEEENKKRKEQELYSLRRSAGKPAKPPADSLNSQERIQLNVVPLSAISSTRQRVEMYNSLVDNAANMRMEKMKRDRERELENETYESYLCTMREAAPGSPRTIKVLIKRGDGTNDGGAGGGSGEGHNTGEKDNEGNNVSRGKIARPPSKYPRAPVDYTGKYKYNRRGNTSHGVSTSVLPQYLTYSVDANNNDTFRKPSYDTPVPNHQPIKIDRTSSMRGSFFAADGTATTLPETERCRKSIPPSRGQIPPQILPMIDPTAPLTAVSPAVFGRATRHHGKPWSSLGTYNSIADCKGTESRSIINKSVLSVGACPTDDQYMEITLPPPSPRCAATAPTVAANLHGALVNIKNIWTDQKTQERELDRQKVQSQHNMIASSYCATPLADTIKKKKEIVLEMSGKREKRKNLLKDINEDSLQIKIQMKSQNSKEDRIRRLRAKYELQERVQTMAEDIRRETMESLEQVKAHRERDMRRNRAVLLSTKADLLKIKSSSTISSYQ